MKITFLTPLLLLCMLTLVLAQRDVQGMKREPRGFNLKNLISFGQETLLNPLGKEIRKNALKKIPRAGKNIRKGNFKNVLKKISKVGKNNLKLNPKNLLDELFKVGVNIVKNAAQKGDYGIQCIYKLYEDENDSNGNSKLLNDVCSREISITYVRTEPYTSEKVVNVLEDVLSKCCGDRVKSFIIRNVPSISSDNGTVLQSSAEFIYPVFAYTKSEIVYGHYFVPVLDPPGAFYVTKKDEFSLTKLVSRCLALWPLLAMCIFMSIIAGFVGWLLDTWSNQDEFPRPFLRGWFEGIWWSFISMTTVGYGDIAPKSIKARVFSIVWILAGIIIFSILSGELTTVILKANTVEQREMARQKVGVLKNRVYDRTIVARNGGYAKTVDATMNNQGNEMAELLSLIEYLKNRSVDGIFLDKYTYWHMFTTLQSQLQNEDFHSEEKRPVEYFPHLGEDVSYGLLILNKKRYEFIKPVIEGNKLHLQAAVSSQIYQETDGFSNQERNIFQDMFEEHLVAVCMTVIGIACFGVLLEMFRKRRSISRSGARLRNSFRRSRNDDELV